MDIGNITSINSLIINRKTVKKNHLILLFRGVLAEKSPEIFPKHKEYFFISEYFALN